MTEASDYETALNKGERFLKRGNFLLAKRELEIAQSLQHKLGYQSNVELTAKLQKCDIGIKNQNAKEAIKRGRKLEKKGKLADALTQFEQAQQTAFEDWLPQKIKQLRQKIGHDRIFANINQVEQKHDWNTRLITYDETLSEPNLSKDEYQSLKDKKLIALVHLGHYREAYAWAQEQPPVSLSARYHLGYAQAAQGFYLGAIDQWLKLAATESNSVKNHTIGNHTIGNHTIGNHTIGNTIINNTLANKTIVSKTTNQTSSNNNSNSSSIDKLHQQIIALVPLAYQEAIQSTIPDNLYTQLLPLLKDNVNLKPILDDLKSRTITSLWNQAKYQEVAQHLLPLPKQPSVSELGIYARLYLQLAVNNIEYLQMAITLWLTAIYNPFLIQQIITPSKKTQSISAESLQQSLQKELDQLFEQYDRQGLINNSLRGHYQTEKRVIQAISSWQIPHEHQKIWPCTSAYAAQFDLSNAVLKSIDSWSSMEQWDESILSIAVYFTATGYSLQLAEMGETDRAIANLPKSKPNDKLSLYCWQKVAWICGLELVMNGNPKGKSYLMEALPLLVEYPQYRKDLIEITLGKHNFDKLLGLVDIMERFAYQIDDLEFREAAANFLCQKSIFLANKGSARSVYKRYVDRARSLCPNCYSVQDTYTQFNNLTYHEQYNRAYSKGKLSAIVAVIERSKYNRNLVKHFLTAMEKATIKILDSNTTNPHKIKKLQEILVYTKRAAPNSVFNIVMEQIIDELDT